MLELGLTTFFVTQIVIVISNLSFF